MSRKVQPHLETTPNKRRRYRPEKGNSTQRRKPLTVANVAPGSAEKVEILAARAEREEELHIDGDLVGAEHCQWAERPNGSLKCVGTVESEAVSIRKRNLTIAGKIFSHMERMRLNRKQVCLRAPIPPATLSRLLRGTRIPHVTVLIALADLFGVSLDSLVGRASPKSA